MTNAAPATPLDLPADAEALRAMVLTVMAERDAAVPDEGHARKSAGSDMQAAEAAG